MTTRYGKNATPAERLAFYSNESTDGCINWTGAISRYGYGRCYVNGTEHIAHRLAYILARGPVPDGLVLDHLCSNRRCINPDHLEPVTQAENLARSPITKLGRRLAGQCMRGHDVTGDNGRVNSQGTRVCLTCTHAPRRVAVSA